MAGLPLVIVASAFLAYGLGGQYLPGILRHDGVTYKMLCEQLYLVTEGLYGIPLAVSGKINMIAPSASMTVHPVRMSGTMIAAPQTYRYFDKLQESIVRFVAAHSQIRAETFRELMLRTDEMANDVGSVLYGEDAVALGLMQQVGTLKDALAALYRAIDEGKKREREA